MIQQFLTKRPISALCISVRCTVVAPILFLLFVGMQSCFFARPPKITYEEPLQLEGEKIRTDGYYYNRSDEDPGYIHVLIFFRDGMLSEGYYKSFEKVDSFLTKYVFVPTQRSGAFRVKNNVIDLKYYVVKNSTGRWAINSLQGQVETSNTLRIRNEVYQFKEHKIVLKQDAK